jgi:hypothetical protein
VAELPHWLKPTLLSQVDIPARLRITRMICVDFERQTVDRCRHVSSISWKRTMRVR